MKIFMPVLKKKNFFIFGTIILIVVFGIGFWFGKSQKVCPVCQPQEVDFSLFWETWSLIEEKFVDKENFDVQEMIYGAISGMVRSLNDPYTVFLPPEETKTFLEDVKGTFEGVGMEIGIRENQLQVIAPLEGTPAQKAGFRAGDKIMKIDEKSTIDVTVEEAVNLIRGPKGTTVNLTIFREEWGETKEFKITRATIDIPSLKWEIIEEDIAYIKLYQFTEKASFDFRTASFEILSGPAKKIILDLRNNPGGYLDVAQDIAGWFLKKDEIVVIEDFGENKKREEFKSKGPSRFLEYPIAVLINEGSASGSEILAGALRDNRGIMLIGEKTFGKGSIQELERLRGGSSLKITIAKWLTPNGGLISGIGLEPDIGVEMTEEDYEEDRDPQLEKAIEIIKEMI